MPILGTVASGFTILATPTVESLVIAGGGSGGSAGDYINGNSNVTWVSSGTLLGGSS